MVTKIVPIFLSFFILLSFSSLTNAAVTITVEDGVGYPGAHENRVAVNLDYFSLDTFVRAFSMDVCDGNDYVTCTGCEPTGRAISPCVRCYSSQQSSGCCRVLLADFSSSNPIIHPGEGPVMNIIYDVPAIGMPLGECTDLTIENVQVADQFNIPMDVIPEPGDICFRNCTTNAHCMDTPFCNGLETCNAATGICEDGINPCSSPSDDFCEEFSNQCVPEPATPVTLFLGSYAGPPYSTRSIELILYNPDHGLKEFEIDVCDADNYLVCTQFAPNCKRGISWISNFDYYSMELENGCCHLTLSARDTQSLVPTGIGSIGNFIYEVLENAPLGVSKNLNIQNIRAVDENDNELAVTSYAGKFCFSADPDSDGVSDCEDNCPSVSNPDQADGDGDGIGNVCETTSAAIPTLSEWGMIIFMTIIMGTGVIFILRRKEALSVRRGIK